MSAHDGLWGLISAHDGSLAALMRSHELGTMEQWAFMRAQEQSFDSTSVKSDFVAHTPLLIVLFLVKIMFYTGNASLKDTVIW